MFRNTLRPSAGLCLITDVANGDIVRQVLEVKSGTSIISNDWFLISITLQYAGTIRFPTDGQLRFQQSFALQISRPGCGSRMSEALCDNNSVY